MRTHALGFSVFLAIIPHKVPSAFALSTILAHAGYSRKKIVVMMVAFALLVPLGVVIYAGLRVALAALPVEGFAVAFACGSFLHIALSDLIPEMHRTGSNRYVHTGLFLAGIAAMASLGQMFPHAPAAPPRRFFLARAPLL